MSPSIQLGLLLCLGTVKSGIKEVICLISFFLGEPESGHSSCFCIMSDMNTKARLVNLLLNSEII